MKLKERINKRIKDRNHKGKQLIDTLNLMWQKNIRSETKKRIYEYNPILILVVVYDSDVWYKYLKIAY